MRISAVARGTSRASAELFARRKRWQRQAGNDGHARVFVPMAYADNARTSSRDEVADGPGGDPHGSISAPKSAIDVLRHQLVCADARSDKAEAERDQANAKAAEALGRLADLEAALRRPVGRSPATCAARPARVVGGRVMMSRLLKSGTRKRALDRGTPKGCRFPPWHAPLTRALRRGLPLRLSSLPRGCPQHLVREQSSLDYRPPLRECDLCRRQVPVGC